MARLEKRKYKRLAINLDLSCRVVDSAGSRFFKGKTVNVCPGGLYIEVPKPDLKAGDVLKLSLDIPPTCGILEYGGRISGYARVLRINELADGSCPGTGRVGVAVEFCRPPRLCR